MPKDHYELYMMIYFSVMTVIFIYLVLQKHTTEEIKQESFLQVQSKDDTAVLLSSVILVLPAMLVLGLAMWIRLHHCHCNSVSLSRRRGSSKAGTKAQTNDPAE